MIVINEHEYHMDTGVTLLEPKKTAATPTLMNLRTWSRKVPLLFAVWQSLHRHEDVSGFSCKVEQ